LRRGEAVHLPRHPRIGPERVKLHLGEGHRHRDDMAVFQDAADFNDRGSYNDELVHARHRLLDGR
jgi:hypothetical protein